MAEQKTYFEDITESMNGNPDVEAWTSVVHGMDCYRVHEIDGSRRVYVADMENNTQYLADPETAKKVEGWIDGEDRS